MNTAELETRIQILEDLEAIKNVTARYTFPINKGWNRKQVDVSAMPAVFAEDAVWACRDMNVCVQGVAGIMLDLPESMRQVSFSMHSFINPVIEADRDTATGNWLFWVASRHAGGSANAIFMSADIVYVRAGQGWLIQFFDLHYGAALHPRNSSKIW